MKEDELKFYYNNVLGQAISESRRFLFAGNRFGDIFVFDLKELDKSTDKPPTKLKLYKQGKDVDINCLSFHRDFLIVGAIGIIYGLKWNEDEQTLSSTRNWEIKIPISVDAVEVPDVNYMWLRPNTDKLYAGCGDNIVYQINLEDGRIERDYRGHTDYVHTVTGTNQDRLYSCSEDGTVRCWCETQKQQTALIEPYKHSDLYRTDWGKWIGAVAANDNWLICGGGPKLSIWHLNAMEYTNNYPFPGRVHICDFIDDSIFVGGEHNYTQLYNLSGLLLANIPVELTASYSVIWQTEPNKVMSIAGFGNKLHILKDFRFLDCKIDLYGNVHSDMMTIDNEESNDEVDDSDDCDI